MCNPAGDLVFKVPRESAADLDGAHLLSQLDDLRVSCDVLLWSGVNAAHSCVEIGNYRQAILAYEACIKRLHETTAALEAAGNNQNADHLVVSVLEAKAKGKATEDEADKLVTLSDAEKSERRRVERDLRLYLVRALYIQAKATKDLDVMRTALTEARELCAKAEIEVPESELKNAMQSAEGAGDKDATGDKDAAGDKDVTADEKTDAEGDVEMDAADKQAPAEATNGSVDGSDKPAKPRVRLSPEDGLVLFDLALVEQSVAQLTGDLPELQRSLVDIDSATSDLEHSTALFTFLASWGKSMQKRRQKLLYSPRLATERSGYGKSLVAKLARKRQEQEELERQRQEHVEQWRKQQQEAEAKKKEEQERLDNERREEETRILRETEERNAIIREQMAADAAKQATEAAASGTAGRSKKTKKQAAADDGFISDNDDLEDQVDTAARDRA
ncbi:hypothetical protein H4S01_006493, partial [Coemansia sp. RSA 2610]